MTSLCSKVSVDKWNRDCWGLGIPKELRVPLSTGSQFSATSADGILCSVLLCSVVPARRLDSVTWLEGRGSVRGHVQPFWSNGAALLLVCPEDELSESRGRRPRTIRCLAPQNKGVSFSLTGKLREDMGQEVAFSPSHTCWLEQMREAGSLLLTS